MRRALLAASAVLLVLAAGLVAPARPALAQNCSNHVAGWHSSQWVVFTSPPVGSTFTNMTDPGDGAPLNVYVGGVHEASVSPGSAYTVPSFGLSIQLRGTSEESVAFRYCEPVPPTATATVTPTATEFVLVTATPTPTVGPTPIPDAAYLGQMLELQTFGIAAVVGLLLIFGFVFFVRS